MTRPGLRSLRNRWNSPSVGADPLALGIQIVREQHNAIAFPVCLDELCARTNRWG